MNPYVYGSQNPLTVLDPFGFSGWDLITIGNQFNMEVNNMIANGNRLGGGGHINGAVNNILSTFGAKDYFACGDQAAYVKVSLDSLKLDDKWTFSVVHPNIFHMNIQGRSSNPTDPDLILDPWLNTIDAFVHGGAPERPEVWQ
jgi:hypothetical protein